MRTLLAMFTMFSVAAFAADAPPPTIGKVLDGQLTSLERELVPLAEAMPADKYDFAPTRGEFKGVRTFAQQAKHVAAVIYLVSAAVLDEKPPAEAGTGESGRDSDTTKDAIVQYLKGSIAYAHKAMQSVTPDNVTGLVQSPFGNNKATRLSMANIAVWHSFDHYGQMVVYLRMNGIIPPASRQ